MTEKKKFVVKFQSMASLADHQLEKVLIKKQFKLFHTQAEAEEYINYLSDRNDLIGEIELENVN